MDISMETTSALGRRLKITVADRVDKAVAKRLHKLSHDVKLAGFRPGKVPLSVMKKRFEKPVHQEVIQEILQETFSEALEKEHLHLAGSPKIDVTEAALGKPFVYTAEFEVLPEFEPEALGEATVEKYQVEVLSADVDAACLKLAQQYATWEVVERPAAETDQLMIDFVGMLNGEKFEGGSADNVPLVLGSHSMIPGFETGLVGLKAGETTTLNLTFPADYFEEKLANQAVVFEVKVHQVSASIPPPLDDMLAEKLGAKTGGVAQLKKDVQMNLERETQHQCEALLKEQVYELLGNRNAIEIPQALITTEINRLKEAAMERLGVDFNKLRENESLYQEMINKIPDGEYREKAEKNVKTGLILSKLTTKYKMEADPDKVKARLATMASAYEAPEKMMAWYAENPERLAPLANAVLEEQLVAKLLETVTVKEVSLSVDELTKKVAH